MCHSESPPLRAVSFGYTGCLSPGESQGLTGPFLPCHICRLKRKPPSGKFLLPEKENKTKLRVLVSEELGLGLNEPGVPCHQGLRTSTATTVACSSGAPLGMKLELCSLKLPKSPPFQPPELYAVCLLFSALPFSWRVSSPVSSHYQGSSLEGFLWSPP